ncbi:AraC-type DNA-binding protein [Nannocystis exedens]|uniref:AraC-type DNA-binding protein n=1 Tax=Nannocystis exedens TaxID=54 RepID=A0A1I1UXK6_9BACT|nr:AraC family transcriptional regulator [Nannocystis exedens]PCC72055.1 AraC family transcriptional regulator [Nannocystis exedens]SFD73563.1 AraC-type DNA-binding protein [Nannocystis exedens]
MTVVVDLPVSLPGLRAVRWTSDALHTCTKDYYAVGRVEQGRCEWWGRGKVWRSAPGSIQIKQPGDVYRDLARDGATTCTIVTLPANDVARVRDAGEAMAPPQLEANDGRAQPFQRLLDAVCAGAERLTLEVVLAEAIDAFAVIRSAKPDHTRPVRRAMEYLRERLADSIRLDDLARHADLDKFHLCRAFRAQVGMPPHTYLTQLRIARAKELLLRGVRASEVAPLVGFYDQAQLTRHFRRIAGTTPARYGKRRVERGERVARATRP